MKVSRFCAAAFLCSFASIAFACAALAEPLSFETGKRLFVELAQPQCALCHTLADAKSAGDVGPNLDDLKPDLDRVKTAVVNGIGAMPPYEGLTKEQIDAVAAYVSTVAGKVK